MTWASSTARRRAACICCASTVKPIRPAFRGLGLGRAMALRIISRAREAGYREMLLDTLPFLTAAQALYRSLGFCEIERYNDSPMTGSTYMLLRL